ncbi:hypothetical protein HYT58_00085 [Candidatus Woesearchaeota archaeon]|nr:hypothetical protein [Candidatus Woesearchaeota archaeon]
MKKWLIISLVVLFAAVVSAEFSLEKGFSWLVSKSSNGGYGDIQTSSIAGMAFRNGQAGAQATAAIRFIKDQEDAQHCWPKGSCKIKDTAFAMLLLNAAGDNVENVENYLRGAQTSALVQGNWWLQIATGSNGTCKISYFKDNKTNTRNVVVNKGAFPTCNNGATFFDLNTCLDPGLLRTNPNTVFDVDCTELGSAIISVVFNVGNSYYLMQEADNVKSKISVSSGCYGLTSKASCDIETSLYTSWALKEAGSDINVLPWVEANYDSGKIVHNSLLTLATKSNTFADALAKLQKQDGSFGNSVYETALSMIALQDANFVENAEKARGWLTSKQQTDGSFGGKILDTAIALYALTYQQEIDAGLAGCNFDGVKNGLEEGVDCGSFCSVSCEDRASVCGDGICTLDESISSCPNDCQGRDICVRNNECDALSGETSANCPTDCSCGDRVCDDLESNEGSCLEDCGTGAVCGNDLVEGGEECDGKADDACPGKCTSTCDCPIQEKRGGSRWWLWLILILLLAAGGWFYYKSKKGKDGKPGDKKSSGFSFWRKKPEKKEDKLMISPLATKIQGMQNKSQQKFYIPRPVAGKEGKTKTENELDKSIKEAKKLLGK